MDEGLSQESVERTSDVCIVPKGNVALPLSNEALDMMESGKEISALSHLHDIKASDLRESQNADSKKLYCTKTEFHLNVFATITATETPH